MIRKVSGTIITRFLTLLGAFLIVVLNTNALGNEGQGTIALISFSVMCVLAVINYIGGGAVVYLTPRLGIAKLVIPAYMWAFSIALLVYIGLKITPYAPSYAMEIALLSLLHGLFTFHMQILVGKERIKDYNVLQIIQVFALLLFLFVMYKLKDQCNVDAFILSLMASFIIVLVVSLIMVFRYLKNLKMDGLLETLKEILTYSKYAQTANVLQILNYRLNFILIENLILSSRGIIGVYSVGMYMSEAVWNVSKSLSMVQYSRISNVDNKKYNNKLTVSFFRVSVVLTLGIVIIMLAVPESVYTFIFGSTFEGIKIVLCFIAPGILFNSGSVIISHYFSGIGKYKYNMLASAIGLGGTLISGFLLIGPLELKGASITFSIAMALQLIYLLFRYSKEGEISIWSLWNPIQEIKDIWRKIRQ